jgi:polyisoprenoid-binding protein YceI
MVKVLYHMADSEEITKATRQYVISKSLSRFTVQAFSGGILSVLGQNPVISVSDFTGEVQLGDDIAESSFTMIAHAASLKVASDMSDKDRIELERKMHEQVLETSMYPEIVYRSFGLSANKSGTERFSAVLNGELSLHGVTHSQPISALVTADENLLKASGTFTIRQTDYHIELVSAAAGALTIKDEVKFSFEIVAKRQRLIC